jgi:hypothetical protein
VHHVHLDPSIALLYLLCYSTADLPFIVDIQGKPTIVHIGHYGQPTVTCQMMAICPAMICPVVICPAMMNVTVSPSHQPQDEMDRKLHALRKYARDFRHQHTTDAQDFNWDLDNEDHSLAIGHLVVT